ncbi:acyl-CoA dehydrogenase family protein [Actinomadura violacea]|uniref:Acyl-CoA dehydrogenase family protein n=1 Tax=Actinomadura violacea TaxID=2819934 RepID=A0ABS3RNJ8_9ACTN|nr:acyl-CoA dehydrogenase family protein [Actinomadura violacea]MBO2458307.1 acyl-CoA dehydrogenase family protein [Actinomadura violacea]
MTVKAMLPAARFEAALGDPHDPSRPFNLAESAALDEAEEFPARAAAELDRLGLPAYYVPAAHGGELHDQEELFHLVRVLARRDLSVAIGHVKTYLGAVSAWVCADPVQARSVGAGVAAGQVFSWALTEREHGSDLLAGEVTAERAPGGGYVLRGEKWLVNNATRGRWSCVLARTDPAGGPRGFTLFMVDKRALPAGRHRCLPKVRTHGIRGADISGIAFLDAEVGPEARVGAEGGGLDIVLRALQLTRTLCGALSVGAADHALRVALDLLSRQRRFGAAVTDLPLSRRELASCYADLLLCEAVGLVTSRSAQTLPGELAVGSAVTKFLVPTTVDRLLGRLAKMLGVRALMGPVPDGAFGTCPHGRFQKLHRDHRIVAMFDGNTVVNLNLLVNHFPMLVRGHRNAAVDDAGLERAADLGAPVPAVAADELTLISKAGSSVVQALPGLVRRVRADGPADLAELAGRVQAAASEVHLRMAEHAPAPRLVPAEAFAAAEDYTSCYAAAACLALWVHGRPGTGMPADLWTDAVWVKACLVRLLGRLEPAAGDGRADGAVDALYGPLLARHQEGSLFSLLDMRLPDRRPADEPDRAEPAGAAR